jgi:putative ABC transport system permease protein
MKLGEIKYSLTNLVHRKMRSFLSVLSILIGITAIFALVSFGLGMRDYMETIAAEAGTDKLYIQHKGPGGLGLDENFFFTKDEINFVGKIKGVDEILGMYVATPEIEFKKQKKYAFLVGIDPGKIEFVDETFTVTVEKGRHLKKGDIRKVVLGYLYQFDDKMFKRGVDLGDKVYLNREQFEVIGFYEEVGNPQDDSNIYISEAAYEVMFPEKKEKYGYVMMSSDKGVNPNELADKIEEKLRKYRGQEEGKEDFFVMTFADAFEIFANIMNVINGILVLIALVSLVVAAVNIMNTMYTAVLERTREIGVMKAVGAKNSNIMLIFVIESGLLGTVGGIIGIAFGYVIAKIGGYAVALTGYGFLQPVFPWYLVAGCILFAFGVGALAGLLPARQASRLQPVDALRYE